MTFLFQIEIIFSLKMIIFSYKNPVIHNILGQTGQNILFRLCGFPLLQIGTTSHRYDQRPCAVKLVRKA